MISLKETFWPVHKRMPEIACTIALTAASSLVFPKAIDNVIPHPATRWLEKNASLLQVWTTLHEESEEEVKTAATGNAVLSVPILFVCFYGIAALDWVAKKVIEESGNEPTQEP